MRTILDLQKFDIDAFDEFGFYKYNQTQTILPEHSHGDRIEICYLVSGFQQYFVEGKGYDVLGGNIFISFPHEKHGTGNVPEKKGKLFWMVINNPKRKIGFLGLNQEYSDLLYLQLLQIDQRLFKASKLCDLLFNSIFNIYNEPDDLFKRLELRNYIVSLLVEIIRKSKCPYKKEYNSKIEFIIAYIHEHLEDNFELDELADKCFLSRSRFKHLFKEEVGVPPIEYIQRQKIKKAEKLILARTTSIKNIAYDLGFSSASYFTTVFKKYNTLSPTEYQIQFSRS